MKLPKLLDCPFCGQIATLAEDRNQNPTSWSVVCVSCGASVSGPIFHYKSMEEAAKAWNRRGGIDIDPDDRKESR